MNKTFYLTTPLYYVNDVPHIGHAYTTIAADVLARWKRMNGESVFFLTGTDEHGAKIAAAAEKTGESPQAFVDRIASEYRRMWKTLGITYDDFIQTSEPRHKKVVQDVFEQLKKTSDVYKGVYEDWYCVHDESYFSEGELVNGKCPSCGRDVQRLQEESYFFRLSKYQEPLLAYYAAHPDFLSPPHRANEIINFVRSGLRDLSISRTRVSWGVPVASDPAHVVYVWFDALLNYISAPGYAPADVDAKPFSDRWPADVHLVGKEIFRFHTVIWPAMLMALGLPLPQRVFAHGWWTVEGTKMSKSLGNVVDPHKMAEEYGVDAFRYFLLREVPFGADGDFSEKSLLLRYNAELANNFGNLLQRTVTLISKNFNGVVPAGPHPQRLLADLADLTQRVENGYGALAFHDVLETAFSLMIRTNKYIDEEAPWKITSDEKEKLAGILLECFSVLKTLCVFLSPFMPGKMDEMWEKLGEQTPLQDAGPRLIAAFRQGKIPLAAPNQTVIKGDPLFMRKGGRWK
jgi:methionyl-tRNA synthetase